MATPARDEVVVVDTAERDDASQGFQRSLATTAKKCIAAFTLGYALGVLGLDVFTLI